MQYLFIGHLTFHNTTLFIEGKRYTILRLWQICFDFVFLSQLEEKGYYKTQN